MKDKLLCMAIWLILCTHMSAQGWSSIQEHGVLPTNTAVENTKNLQKAIDMMAGKGGTLFIEPTEGGYPIDGGLILRRNVSLTGVHGPTGRGTATNDRRKPTGSLFIIRDKEKPFITVESATQIRGIQFYYPEQAFDKPDNIIPYPATIQMSQENAVQGVTLSCLTFYGEYMAMDFRAKEPQICEQILFEHCYGYPLSGRFIAIDRCYDVPRILHCHVNPANMREFGRSYHRSVIDEVVKQKTYTYWIDHTDNAQLMDLFTFGAHGGIYLGAETYGQLTNFNFDCVCIGIHKLGSQWKNRNWQISQGSIIANAGEKLESIHPILIEGIGHTSISNVEAFSGDNGALTNWASSWDYMTVTSGATISLSNCRMSGYSSAKPINAHPDAKIYAAGCIDKNNEFFEIRPLDIQENQER